MEDMESSTSATRPYDLGERTFQFAQGVVALCARLEAAGGVARHLGWQLISAGTSIGANYQESQAASSRRDFLCKQVISLKEARESKFWLRLIEACGIEQSEAVTALITEADELVAIFTRSTATARTAIRRQQGG